MHIHAVHVGDRHQGVWPHRAFAALFWRNSSRKVYWQAAVVTAENHCDQDDCDTRPLLWGTVGGGSSVAAAVFVWCSILNYDFSYYSAFFWIIWLCNILPFS